jgi:hypothetical protein
MRIHRINASVEMTVVEKTACVAFCASLPKPSRRARTSEVDFLPYNRKEKATNKCAGLFRKASAPMRVLPLYINNRSAKSPMDSALKSRQANRKFQHNLIRVGASSGDGGKSVSMRLCGHPQR